jgi:signaling intermediate in Toll pathway protein
LAILEQMERNGVIPDEDLGRLAIKIFGDWTHVVRKIKRQLYWLPKFKNANPYPIPYLKKKQYLNIVYSI